MHRKTSVRIPSLITGLLLITLFVVAVIPGTREATFRTLSQPASTPDNLIFLPLIQSTSEPPVDSAGLPPGWVDTDPDVQDVETEGTAEAFNMPIPYPIVPIPDGQAVPGPELMEIKILQQLSLPSKTHSYFGDIAWSPDSQVFVGHYAAWMNGLDEDHLYMGNVETGKLSLVQKNGTWPTWSRDGNYIYYLAPRRDGTYVTVNEFISRPYFDLYRQLVSSDINELLLENVAPPQIGAAQVIESASEALVMVDNSSQIVLMPTANSLIEAAKQRQIALPLAILDATANNKPSDNTSPAAFSISPDGKTMISIHLNAMSPIFSLETYQQIGEIAGLESSVNVAWSSGGNQIAYTNRQGLWIYEMDTGDSRVLATTKQMGFLDNDTRGGFAWPAWLEGDERLLFVVLNRDWVDRNHAANDVNLDYYTYTISIYNRQSKALGRFAIESVSPDKKYAIVQQLDYGTGYFTSAVATIHYAER